MMGYGVYPRIGTIIIVLFIIFITFILPIIGLVLLYRFYRMIENIDRNLDDINKKLDSDRGDKY